jgi:hypothetical protein
VRQKWAAAPQKLVRLVCLTFGFTTKKPELIRRFSRAASGGFAEFKAGYLSLSTAKFHDFSKTTPKTGVVSGRHEANMNAVNIGSKENSNPLE